MIEERVQGVCERYPVDYDTLKQGDRLEPAWLEEFFDISRELAKYSLKACKLSEQIERELWRRGKRWTVAVVKSGVQILTSAEASEYHAKINRQRREQQDRNFRRLAAVDVADLNPDQVKQHDRRLATEGAYIAAMRATDNALKPISHERKHPRLTAE